jgi:hypothetical protein
MAFYSVTATPLFPKGQIPTFGSVQGDFNDQATFDFRSGSNHGMKFALPWYS